MYLPKTSDRIHDHKFEPQTVQTHKIPYRFLNTQKTTKQPRKQKQNQNKKNYTRFQVYPTRKRLFRPDVNVCWVLLESIVSVRCGLVFFTANHSKRHAPCLHCVGLLVQSVTWIGRRRGSCFLWCICCPTILKLLVFFSSYWFARSSPKPFTFPVRGFRSSSCIGWDCSCPSHLLAWVCIIGFTIP